MKPTNNQEAHNNYKIIHGKLIFSGKEPDGDSVAFIPNNPQNFDFIQRSSLLHPSPIDGSSQLRLEGIDATELHYGGALQPLSQIARDYLIGTLLKVNVSYSGNSNPPTKASSAKPSTISVSIACKQLDIHGRPVSYLFKGDIPGFKDGDVGLISNSIIQTSINYQMLESGNAYLLAYSSMPKAHFQIFQIAAKTAKAAKKGVWKLDTTKNFRLNQPTDVEGLNPNTAQVIFPKIFRRIVDFFKSKDRPLDLADWLRNNDKENDKVLLPGGEHVNFSSLFVHQNSHILFQADTNDIIFFEK